MSRTDEVYTVARSAYNTAVDIINEESPDMGAACAACSMVAHWLLSQVDTNALLNNPKLASIKIGADQ